MPKSVATWYGPGFFGKRTACGKTLRRKHDRRRPSQPALRDQGDAQVPQPLRQGPGDRSRPVHERRSLGPDPEDGPKASPHHHGHDPRRPDQVACPPRGGGGDSGSGRAATLPGRPRPACPAKPALERRAAQRGGRAGPTGRTGPAAGRRRWPSGSGTRSAPRGRPPRGSPRRSNRPRGPPRAGGGRDARRPRTAPSGRPAAPPRGDRSSVQLRAREISSSPSPAARAVFACWAIE